ncbi:MAG TPA: hypothetical protein VGN64_05040 [Dyadobacter sp.]|jgi:hypothetical protein|nr:hypothetical protein [Dyadobacter sp.]
MKIRQYGSKSSCCWGLLVTGWFLFLSQRNKELPPQDTNLKPAHPAFNLKTVKGMVVKYGSNHDGDIDKIMISSNDREIWLHFPPDTARSVMDIAPVNARIEAKIEHHELAGRAHGPNLVSELSHISKQSSDEKIDLSVISPPEPTEGTEAEVTGSVPEDDMKKTENTFSLSGKLISLPPHTARELFPLIAEAKHIIVKGKMRDSTGGFVSASGKPVVKANSIQLDSVIYKIR